MKAFLRWVGFTLLCIVVGSVSGLVLLNLTLSGGDVVVPDLKSKDILVALTVLNQRELNLRIVRREYSVTVAKNVIISQRPGAGTRIKRDADVSVVISRGPKEVVVPTLTSETVRRATIVLRRNGLLVGRQTNTPSETHPAQTVLSQNPPAGVVVERGSAVNLLVSTGKEAAYYYLPSFAGRNLKSAAKAVEAMGLKVGAITYEPSNGARPGTVVSQSPPAGSRVEAGEAVRLALAKADLGQEAPGEGTFTVFSYTVPQGVFDRQVKVVVVTERSSETVYDRLSRPGAEIRLLLRVQGEPSARIYLDGELVEERSL
ncbi:MAG: PASTA domain-containing protein [bacterium]|nr:PASTA domain-containing protein [bacterium]